MAKILIAEDNIDFRELIRFDVEEYESNSGTSTQVDLASNGRDAIEYLQKSVNEKVYDLLLTDYQMGIGPDGVDVIEEAVRCGVGKIFVLTNVELNQSLSVLHRRLREAVLKHKVTHINKMDRKAFVKNVYGHLDETRPSRYCFKKSMNS